MKPIINHLTSALALGIVATASIISTNSVLAEPSYLDPNYKPSPNGTVKVAEAILLNQVGEHDVPALIAGKHDFISPNSQGLNSVEAAIAKNDAPLLKALLDAKVVPISDVDFRKLMLQAAWQKAIEPCKVLIAAGASANAILVNTNGAPISSALQNSTLPTENTNVRAEDRWGSPDIANLLLTHGANASILPQVENYYYIGGFPHEAVINPNPKFIPILEGCIKGGQVKTDLNDRWGSTPLHWAAFAGNTNAITMLLKNGANIEATNMWGMTPLLYAAASPSSNSLAATTLLIQKGANPKATSTTGIGLPLVGAITGDENILRLSAQLGCDLNQTDTSGHNTAFYSKMEDHPNSLRYLASKGVSPKGEDNLGVNPLLNTLPVLDKRLRPCIQATEATPAIVEAIVKRNNEQLVALIDEAKKKGLPISESEKMGIDALCVAVTVNNLEATKALLKAGANPNKQYPDGTLVWKATDAGNEAILKALLEGGANPNIPNLVSRGECPGGLAFIVAANLKSDRIFNILINNGMDVNKNSLELNQPGEIITGYAYLTPLLCAIDGNKLDIVKRLIDKGANVNYYAKDYGTVKRHNVGCLSVAAVGGNTEIIKLLLSKGADKNAVSSSGRRPYDTAILNNHPEAAELLK